MLEKKTCINWFSRGWELFFNFSGDLGKFSLEMLLIMPLTYAPILFRTISARVFAISVFATVYRSWILIVITLHWFAMLLYILASHGFFNGSKYSACTRVFYSSLVAWVYIFDFINLNEVRKT